MARSRVAENYKTVVCRVLCEIFLEKKMLRIVDVIFQRITNLNVHEIEDLNLFAG